MKTISLPEASLVYSQAKGFSVRRHRVRHDDFAVFSFRLQELKRACGDEEDNELLQPFVRRLRRYWFDLCAAPLPFNSDLILGQEALCSLSDRLLQCELSYPRLAAQGRQLLQIVERLAQAGTNPLLERLIEIYSSSNDSSGNRSSLTLLIKEPRLIPICEEVLARTAASHQMEIVSEAQLRGGKCYDEIAVVGPSRWFAPHVFSAPRARQVHLVHFSCLNDKWQPASSFVGSTNSSSSSSTSVTNQSTDPEGDSAEDVSRQEDFSTAASSTYSAPVITYHVEVDELTPTVNLEQISRRLSRSSSPDTEHEDVEARIFQLEGGMGVCLEAVDGSSALVIDLQEEDALSVKRAPVSAISPGMFVLLRAGGGGDFLVPLADQILGKNAERIRKIQHLWKVRLRDEVRKRGALEVSIKLIDFGSIRANEANVRNWMSERSIRTEDYRDFAAIMKLVEMGDDATRCWNIMGLIDRAHRKAGRQIRRLLLQQVINSDLSELIRCGRMQFEISETGSGSMVACRVVAISPTIRRIPAWHIARQFKLEED